MKILIFKKRFLYFALASTLFLAGCLATYLSVKPTISPKTSYSIVIDAGHGGIDGGASGKTTGVRESELNLKYAKELEKFCCQVGLKTTLTRSDMNGLYEDGATNKKKSEMEKRKQIINSSGADIMVSIHMNSFPISSCNGAQIFYAKGSREGFKLAKSVQESVCKSFSNARTYVTVGDYFVLNTSVIPSILIECGFLTNAEEEKNLVSDFYREKFCKNLLVGILSYFEM